MKITVNKSAKRVLSIALALAMLVGSLFTANIGVNTITADAATIAEGTIDLYNGTPDSKLADNGETGDSWDNAIIIDSAAEFVYLTLSACNETIGNYYKVADGLAGFDLSNGNLDLDGTLADNLLKIQGGKNKHKGTANGFQGHFDGNGVTVYGAYDSGNSYAGVFPYAYGEVSIKNLHVRLSSFSASYNAAGLVGKHSSSDGVTGLTIENCSVVDCYLKSTGKGYYAGTGAIAGYVQSYVSSKNAPIRVNNCFVNLNEDYFISAAEDGVLDTDEVAQHGGVVAFCTSNDLIVSNCISIGVKPYSTTETTTVNQIQHSGHANNYENVYTDQEAGTNTYVGGTTNNGYQNFTGYVTQLTTEQLTGADAVSNMNLDWFSVWLPGEEGEYPSLAPQGYESNVDFWDGSIADEYAGGTGTKEDPFIIETAEQLYKAVGEQLGDTVITYTNKIDSDTKLDTGEDAEEKSYISGGYKSGDINHQSYNDANTAGHGHTVPVYTPYYYKVADGVEAFYLNNVYGNKTLAGAKAMGTNATGRKEWKPGKSFVGHLDGNGVTIYGLYSSTGQGLIYKLDGSSEVRNINFNACYSTATGGSAFLTTFLGSYNNDSTIINVSNISVVNSYSATTRNIGSAGANSHGSGAAAVISTGSTCENITVSNCFVDAYSCEFVQGSDSVGTLADGYVNYMGTIYSGGHSANNFTLTGCVSLGAPAVDEVVSDTEINYSRYDANQGFQVFFYDCYTDYPSTLTDKYDGKYDKLLDIERIETADQYNMYDMPKLDWANWEMTEFDNDRVLPMPTVIKSDEIGGSFINAIAKDHDNFASVGPYKQGSNPHTYKLKGAGTEDDPFIIETAAQLARAIATGGMNLYDRLYYRLGNDIDLSGGSWIKQIERHSSAGHYTYTPFGGVLDGAGYTIYNLSAGDGVQGEDGASAGLIPVLDGGRVHNVHVRNAVVVSDKYAGVIVGEMRDSNKDDAYIPTITNCSVEDSVVSTPDEEYNFHFVGYELDTLNGYFGMTKEDAEAEGAEAYINNVYYISEKESFYYTEDAEGIIDGYGCLNGDAEWTSIEEMPLDTGIWYIGGNDGSMPRLVSQGAGTQYLDVDGDGIVEKYAASDLTALRNKLLRKSAYANICGDVGRDGAINIADLAILKRVTVDDDAVLSDSFFFNVEAGAVRVYYGENDNYDAARKVELYLESLFPGLDVVKCVSTSKGTVTGADSDSSKVYLHSGDVAETPDGKLDIIVGNLDNVNAYKTNTVATAVNTYAVEYDDINKVVWIQGENFTAVEQAAINFTNGCSIDGDVVYQAGSTELEDYKKPVTVKLDTNYDGTIDTDKTLYYAWGDEFDEDTVNTYNWQHNNQQTEGTDGSTGSYNNLEIAPVKDLNKVLTIEDGKLHMKRGHARSLGGDTTGQSSGSVALDVTAGEFNGYNQTVNDESVNAIDTDGSDQYFGSGKVTTERGMLYKQGYLEFSGRLPADGHAFPAWWLMGRPAQSQTNQGYDNSLYSKIYKTNDNWNGSKSYAANDLDTYKYQIPSAIYEIDMIEVMQHSRRHRVTNGEDKWWGYGGSYYNDDYKTYTKAVYYYTLNSTIHKWWNNGTAGTDLLYIQDWDNYTVSTGIANSNFKTTSSAGSWIHNIGSTALDFGTPTEENKGTYYYKTGTFDQTAHDNLTAERKYGFSWYTDGVSGFEATLYVYNIDGTLYTTVPIASGMSDLNAFKDSDEKTEANGAIGTTDSGAYKNTYSDAKVFNQYMYILFDNKYYTSNDLIGNASTNMFTDLLTSVGLKELIVDYVRVYQQEGERDIVTQETQAFNNSNHFGY